MNSLANLARELRDEQAKCVTSQTATTKMSFLEEENVEMNFVKGGEIDDPLGRAPGEPLWPQRFDAAHHTRTRRRVCERVWGALYMQKPRPPEGGV
ncbi:hypothetical protein ACWCXK_06285 [Streptomyces sp. NPDC001739]